MKARGPDLVISGKTFEGVPSIQIKTAYGGMTTFANVEGNRNATPSLESQVINVAEYETITVNPITSILLNQLDSDFVAGNIKNGVDLFGLMGTMESGNNIRVETGTVTFAEDTKLYNFVSDNPDVLFVHLDFPEASMNNSIPLTQYNYQIGCDTQYIYAFIQYPKIWKAYNYNKTKIEYDIGYASGTKKIYAVTTVAQDKTGRGPSLNGYLGAGLTYRYWAIYGVTVE